MAEFEDPNSGFLNLVRSLMASYYTKGGMPIPATQQEELAAGIGSAANAALLNQTPRLSGALSAAGAALTGEDPAAAYEAERLKAAGTLDAVEAQYPGTSLAGELVGAVASPTNAVYKLAGKVPTVAGRIIGNAALGAAQGATTVSGEANPTAEQIQRGGLVGGALGAAGGALVETAQGLASAYPALIRGAAGITKQDIANFFKGSSEKVFAKEGRTVVNEGLDILREEGKLPATFQKLENYQSDLAENAGKLIGERAQKATKILEPIDEELAKTTKGVLRLRSGPRIESRLKQLPPDLRRKVIDEAKGLYNEVFQNTKGIKYYGLTDWAKRKRFFKYDADPTSASGFMNDLVNDTISYNLAKYDAGRLGEVVSDFIPNAKTADVIPTFRIGGESPQAKVALDGGLPVYEGLPPGGPPQMTLGGNAAPGRISGPPSRPGLPAPPPDFVVGPNGLPLRPGGKPNTDWVSSSDLSSPYAPGTPSPGEWITPPFNAPTVLPKGSPPAVTAGVPATRGERGVGSAVTFRSPPPMTQGQKDVLKGLPKYKQFFDKDGNFSDEAWEAYQGAQATPSARSPVSDAYRSLLDEEKKLLSVKGAVAARGSLPAGSIFQDVNKALFTTGSAGALGGATLGAMLGAPAAIAGGVIPGSLIALSVPMGRRALAEGFIRAPALAEKAAAGGRIFNTFNHLNVPTGAPQEEGASPTPKVNPIEAIRSRKGGASTPSPIEAIRNRVSLNSQIEVPEVTFDGAPGVFGDVRFDGAAQIVGNDVVQSAIAKAGGMDWIKAKQFLPIEARNLGEAVAREVGR